MTNYIERIMFTLFGRTVPVVRVADIDDTGKINTLQILPAVKDRANSLVDTFGAVGWEKVPGRGYITFIDAQGVQQGAHVVSQAGMTVNLYTEPRGYPNWEEVIGKGATADDIADNMDLEKSNRKLFLGIAIGMPIGYMVFTLLLSILTKIAS